MANIFTVVAMSPSYLPFERPPDRQALWSAIPRGIVGFSVRDQVLDAKPLNDTQTFQATGSLPTGFAYVFAEIGLRFFQLLMTEWNSSYSLQLINWYQGREQMTMAWNFDFPLAGGQLTPSTRNQGPTALSTLPKQPMWAPRGTAIEIEIRAFNGGATATAAGNAVGFVNFWQFDLEQVRKYPIQTPLPTHSR